MNTKRYTVGQIFRFSVLGLILQLFIFTLTGDAGNSQKDSPWKVFIPLVNTGSLSPAQSAFIGEIGYPQQFIKMFSYEGEKERVDEIWVYTQHNLMEHFINGIFIKEAPFSGSYAARPPSGYRPQEFHRYTMAQDIMARFGQPSSQKEETIWNGTLKTYVYPSIFFVFNNDRLVALTVLR